VLVCREGEIADGDVRLIKVGPVEIGVIRHQGSYYAYHNLSSDYPHWDMDLPSTIYDLSFLDMNAKRAILGGNAQRLLKLDPVMSRR
jgi:hypothetical protein